jgi:hypothetical protein
MDIEQVPQDLRRLYELGSQHRAWVRTADDVATDEGARIGPHPDVCALIERIAALEQSLANARADAERFRLAGEREVALYKGERGRLIAMTAEVERMTALMELACADIIFFHSQESGPFVVSGAPELSAKVAFSVLVNDLFYPAADSEEFHLDDAIMLRDIFRRKGYEGVIRWVQEKRGGAVLRPHIEARIKEKEDLRQERDRMP